MDRRERFGLLLCQHDVKPLWLGYEEIESTQENTCGAERIAPKNTAFDEWIGYEVYLKQGEKYFVRYTIEEFTPEQIRIADLEFVR